MGTSGMYQVYLVDDDMLILDDIISRVPWLDNGFEVAGYQTDPLRAIGEILELKPDVVFLDLKMPAMDGNELIRRLRDSGSEAEYVMISAYDSFANVRDFFQQSGFDYILKPINDDDMQMVLEGLNHKLSLKVSPQFDENSNDTLTNNPKFNSLITYVDEHFTENITLEFLAKEFAFARTYICGLFQKYLNKSLTVYLTQRRMQYAKTLIVDEKRQIKEVAVDCGYADYRHFYKAFKRYYGISPREMQETLPDED
ncbi:MAG: DNA-binding response regulator [Lachnospiraceae bacterium]|nr:DNA-binding response regulator [Lachnospiraceae bacterium]